MNQVDFRSETLRRFAAWKLQANPSLPFLEPVADLPPKSAAEVARRAMAAGFAAACFGAPTEKVGSSLQNFHLLGALSPEEQSLLMGPTASDDQKHFHGWLIESIHFIAADRLFKRPFFFPATPRARQN